MQYSPFRRARVTRKPVGHENLSLGCKNISALDRLVHVTEDVEYGDDTACCSGWACDIC